jgi:hypothetical protein
MPDSFHYHEHITSAGPLDLDGMTVVSGVNTTSVPDPDAGMSLDLGPVVKQIFPDNAQEGQIEVPEWGDSPATASWGPFMAEVCFHATHELASINHSQIFGPGWQCPSPVVLHLGDPDPSLPTLTSNAICPVWKKSNELFGKVLSCRATSGTGALSPMSLEAAEAGLLFLGIQQGWDSSDVWMQSPTLRILREVDDLLFCHLRRIERLAVAYKSFKLLKVPVSSAYVPSGPRRIANADLLRAQYYRNATRDELDKVPSWLQPRYVLSSPFSLRSNKPN